MNIKEIKEMIQLMNDNGLTEFELEKDGLKIRLKKTASGGYEQVMVPAHTQPAPGAQIARAQVPAAPVEAPKPAANRNVIKSPMVGTFYAAPAPDAQPFVQTGGSVDVGQVICVIEAMKLMNEIKSEVKGKIVEILVKNGEPVEFGQVLFVLE